MYAIVQRSKAFRMIVTAAAAATLTTCAVTATVSESPAPQAVQHAQGGAPVTALDGFHW